MDTIRKRKKRISEMVNGGLEGLKGGVDVELCVDESGNPLSKSIFEQATPFFGNSNPYLITRGSIFGSVTPPL
jgi:hypothetical protein